MDNELEIKISTANAAFDVDNGGVGYECARILRKIAERLEAGHTAGRCMDTNGNAVGEWGLS